MRCDHYLTWTGLQCSPFLTMNKPKSEIIHEMCLTYRHDYGLRKETTDPPWVAGMTEEEAKMLYKTMEQIYTNNIEPLLKPQKD